MDAEYRIQVPIFWVPEARRRIERALGVRTTARPEGWGWAIYFHAPPEVDLDFLRPDILPPPGAEAQG